MRRTYGITAKYPCTDTVNRSICVCSVETIVRINMWLLLLSFSYVPCGSAELRDALGLCGAVRGDVAAVHLPHQFAQPKKAEEHLDPERFIQRHHTNPDRFSWDFCAQIIFGPISSASLRPSSSSVHEFSQRSFQRCNPVRGTHAARVHERREIGVGGEWE